MFVYKLCGCGFESYCSHLNSGPLIIIIIIIALVFIVIIIIIITIIINFYYEFVHLFGKKEIPLIDTF